MAVGDLVHRVRRPESEPEGALVLFHGRGADENDLWPLLALLDPARPPLGLTPRGPLSLPPAFEHLRDQLEPVLTPLPNPRPSVGAPAGSRAGEPA